MKIYACVFAILFLMSTVLSLQDLSQEHPRKPPVVSKDVDLWAVVVSAVLSIWSVYVFFTV